MSPDVNTPHDDQAKLAPPAADDTLASSEVEHGTNAKRLSFELAEQESPTAPQNLFGRGSIVAGRYKLLEQLGQGGMGTVYLAEQFSPVVRRVALKVIKFGIDSVTTLARFDQERQMLAMMDHDNIAKVYDGGVTEQGFPFIVLELVKGKPITKYCDEKKLSLRERLELFLPVCHAIQHAHQKGVIHRDLKPSNILVSEQMNRTVVKVIDFGVAKALHQRVTDRTIFTEQGSIVGTLEYMAPEQAGTNQLDVDTRADIYSLGAVLYELFTGSTPFTRHELREAALDVAIHKIREIDPPRPSTKISRADDMLKIAATRSDEPVHLSKEVARELDWVTMKCLEKDRNRRYESVGGLSADINHYLHDEPVTAHPPSRGYRLKKFFKRHQAAVLSSLAIIATLMIAFALTVYAWIQATNAGRLAKNENAIHKTLLGFINQDLFNPIDAQERAILGLPLDKDLKVRVLLDRAATQVNDGRFSNQPLIEAALRHTIGRAYLSLGLLTEAKLHLEKARDLRIAHLGSTQPPTLETLEAVAEVYLAQEEHQAARVILDDIWEKRRQALGPSAPATLDTSYQISLVDYWQGKFAVAEERLKAIIDSETSKTRERTNETLQAKNLLATIYQKQQKATQADALFSEISKEAKASLGALHPTHCTILNSYGQFLSQQRRHPEAKTTYEELIPAAKRIHGDENIVTALYKTNYSSTCIRIRDLDKAEKLLSEAIPVFAGKLPNDHQVCLFAKGNMAYLKLVKGEPAAALTIYKEIRPLRVGKFGMKDPTTDSLTKDMINALILCKETDEAIALTREYILNHVADQDTNTTNKIIALMTKLKELANQSEKTKQLNSMIKELQEPLRSNPQLLDKLSGK